MELEETAATEVQCRWSISIDERHGRYVLEKAHQQWIYDDHTEAAPASEPQREIKTIFKGDILEPTIVKRTAPLLALEHKLQLLDRMSDRKGVASSAAASTDSGGYQMRLLFKKESTSRESVEREEAEDHQRLRARCGRGMLSIISAIVTFPQEMRQLAVLRLRDEEREAFVLRPTVLEEHWARSELAFNEREQFARAMMMRTESASIANIYSRFHSICSSITSFLRAQWLMRSVATVNLSIREKYYYGWRDLAHGKHRLRRIVLGLNHIRHETEMKLLLTYAAKWNHPIQDARTSNGVTAITDMEAELRTHMVFYEEECRARSCAEVLESVLFGKLIEEHFSIIGPLIEARRTAASLELEMLNSARHALVRLQTWYFWALSRKNETKVLFLREKAMFYSAQTRFRIWSRFTNRRLLTRELFTTKLIEMTEMDEEATRVHRTAKLLSKHHVLVTRAAAGVRKYDLNKVSKQLATITRIAKIRFWRRFFERWLMYASRHNIESRALFLSRITQHIITTKYYCVWTEFYELRKDKLQLAFNAQDAVRNLVMIEESESFSRIELESEEEACSLRLRRLLIRDNAKQLPALDPQLASQAHLLLRFTTLTRHAHRQITHRNAEKVVSARTFYLLGHRYLYLLRSFGCHHSEAKKREAIEETMILDTYDLFEAIRASLAGIIRDIKYRTATSLAAKNELQSMVAPFRRLQALVTRRRTARSKRPDALALQRKAEWLIVERYIQYWRKVVSRARIDALAVALCKKTELGILRRYWTKFPPSKLRVAKISRVRQELQTAQTAAASFVKEEEKLVGPAKGSALAGKLTLRRQPHHVFM